MKEIGVRSIQERLQRKLRDYIKAQYFSENDLLLEASESILNKPNVLFQEPYIEIAKQYLQYEDGFKKADITAEDRSLLEKLVSHNLGVYSTPYYHQVKAVEAYCNKSDFIVTTGTGSGKTECFIWPLLLKLISEAKRNEWKYQGIRALILYPMNALVSDQVGRLRNILGHSDDTFYKLMQEISGSSVRRLRFGMYTGRTPYAGADDVKKNKNLARRYKNNYLMLKDKNPTAYQELKKIGRIPAKNMEDFCTNLEYGKQITGNEDTELLTRCEMQKICPDVLITNYSMLEYMLMRPIEANFWDKTREWLQINKNNEFLLIIDEAHMYRGAAGGEVSLLIRRLVDRLGIESDQMRCILTSASMPSKADEEIRQFASALSGKRGDQWFRIIRDQLESVVGNQKGTKEEAEFFASLDLSALQENGEVRRKELEKIQKRFQLSMMPKNEIELGTWLYQGMSTFPIIKQVLVMGQNKAEAFSKLSATIFECDVSKDLAATALEVILQLGTIARTKQGKLLLSTKVHMMCRGLQGLYACLNPACPDSHKGAGIIIGHIDTEFQEECPSCHGRMFELAMDRRCGTLFVKAYVDHNVIVGQEDLFLWPYQNQIMGSPSEIHLWPIPEKREDFFKIHVNTQRASKKAATGYLDSFTGMLFINSNYENRKGFIKVLIPTEMNAIDNGYTFLACPNCGRDSIHFGNFKTKGNEPFANIVKEQFETQAIKDSSLQNGGKKILLFSDSRQRAAALAKDLTVVADGDAGRQAIFLAEKILAKSENRDVLAYLYCAFLKVVCERNLDFFYGQGKDTFKEQCKSFEKLFVKRSYLNFEHVKETIGAPPEMFYQLLLKNICDTYRAYTNFGLGQVVLAEEGEAGEDVNFEVLASIQDETGIDNVDLRLIFNTWIQNLLVSKLAVFPQVDDEVRDSILSYDRGGYGLDDRKNQFPRVMERMLLEHGYDQAQINYLFSEFLVMMRMLEADQRPHNRKYINGTWLTLKTAEKSVWYKCQRCAGMSTFTLWGNCIYCGSPKYIEIMPEEKLNRYDLWRKPVLDALDGEPIKNIRTEEHTAQLSHKDNNGDGFITTEKHELAFRNIIINPDETPIDILSCTTTMEVGIDIGTLTSIGLRNVPPMRENYQQRAGRAGRSGSSISTVVTYTEDGPHDAWYYEHPEQIITGEPRIPWIDSDNIKLLYRHLNLILLEEYFRQYEHGLDEIKTYDFFADSHLINCENFIEWAKENLPLQPKRCHTLINIQDFNWDDFIFTLKNRMIVFMRKVQDAPFIYSAPIEDKDERSNQFLLLDFLFSEGFIPNYSFPKNVVHFWTEQKENGLVKESPERSLDIALSEYAPGRAIVINKQTYISGGIFDYYTKFRKENKRTAAKPWLSLNEYNKTIYSCKDNSCSWFGVGEEWTECPMCGNAIEKHAFVKPWGFSAREGVCVPETHDTQELSYASTPYYSSFVSGKNMTAIGTAGNTYLDNRYDQELVIVNKGPEDKGFMLCEECGAIEPAINKVGDIENRLRPYRLPFLTDDNKKCKHTYNNVYLGYQFRTDMLVLEAILDPRVLDLSVNRKLWLYPALTTMAEALSLAASRELDVEYSDLKGGYRLRQSGMSLYADIYLYDSLSSGAGYSNRVAKVMESVLARMEDLLENCSGHCINSCPKCLRNFNNQKEHSKLDRFLGLDFLHWMRNGSIQMEVPVERQKMIANRYNKIASLHGLNEIIVEEGQALFIKERGGFKELFIYPALWNPSEFSKEKFYLKDRECLYAVPDVWRKISTKL